MTRNKTIAAYTAVALASLTIGAGMAGGSSSSSAAPTKTQTVTETKTVEVTPPECVTALNGLRQSGMTIANAASGYVDAIQSAAIGDLVTATSQMKGATAKIEAATSRVSDLTPDYQSCVESAR